MGPPGPARAGVPVKSRDLNQSRSQAHAWDMGNPWEQLKVTRINNGDIIIMIPIIMMLERMRLAALSSFKSVL